MSASFPASSRPGSTSPDGGDVDRPGPIARPVRRATAVVGLVAGAAAALLGLVVCGTIGLVGWYLSDAGSHGVPREGVTAGVRTWLAAHGAGFTVEGVQVTVLPLAVTLVLAWWVAQAGLRLGELVWDHGPDEARRGDGGRDFTLPQATGGFAVGYLAAAGVAVWGAGDGTDGAAGAVIRWSLLMVVVLVGPAVALGAGRAQAWIEAAPVVLRDAFGGAGRLVVAWLVVSTTLFVVAMLVGIGDARAIVDRLGTSPVETVMLVLACLVLVPQAVLWSSAFLLGPGFSVGAGTAVAPSGVLLGPLPLIPILGALPDEGELSGLWAAHLVLSVLVAAWAVGRRHARVGVLGWTPSLMAGAGAGALASLFLALLTSLADGAAGPGRLAHVGARAGEVFLAALPLFVLGGLIGAALGTWWARRTGVVPANAAGRDGATTEPNSSTGGATTSAAAQDVEATVATPMTTADLAAAKASAAGASRPAEEVGESPAPELEDELTAEITLGEVDAKEVVDAEAQPQPQPEPEPQDEDADEDESEPEQAGESGAEESSVADGKDSDHTTDQL